MAKILDKSCPNLVPGACARKCNITENLVEVQNDMQDFVILHDFLCNMQNPAYNLRLFLTPIVFRVFDPEYGIKFKSPEITDFLDMICGITVISV